MSRTVRFLAAVAACVFSFTLPGRVRAAEACQSLLARDNLVAWCIVPFDSRKRTPEERADMLKRLGLCRFAYDWRAEHLPMLERELQALEKNKISLDAVWFPAALDADAKTILKALERHKIHTQLWVTMGDPVPQGDHAAKLAAAVAAIRPIAEAADNIGCTVALYNHGGWFGEPENQLAIIRELRMSNVGIVYNLHHGHDHVDRFETLLKEMMPHLLALNLNGMTREGDRLGKKILPLAQGDVDLPLLRTICASGYRGPIGILGHTMDDAEERLRDNLDGLDWLVATLNNNSPGPKPTPRTPIGEAPPAPAGQFRGRIAEGKPEYSQPPLTVECRAKLLTRENFNILVASDTKASGAHWELFSMAGSGTLTAYMPGMKPDHMRSQTNVCDGAWHDLAMLFEANRVRLLADGKVIADQPIESTGKPTAPGGLAIGRLVEGGIGCNGEVAYVRLSRGIREQVHLGEQPPSADEATIGLWIVGDGRQGNLEDKSPLKNTAKVAAAPVAEQGPAPEADVNFEPVEDDAHLKLIDRSRGDAYLGVKVDCQGRVFVGAREAVYLFEPDAHGEFQLRQEVCRLPADSIVMGLEFRGDDLYVLSDNALYLLPRGRIERYVKPQRILWGLPLDLHVSFHCLAWGPEGDLYLTHGDPLLNFGDWNRPDHWGHWTLYAGPDSEPVPYTGVGAVLRVRPDGSRVQVVATGLRGPVGLAFDRQWNLFTNDNDHESRADLYAPARLLHVTPHIDFAWPRGWIASKSPRRFELVEPLTADLGRGVPCDLVWQQDPVGHRDPLAEREAYGSLLMARWDQMAINRYPLEARGASFKTTETAHLQGRAFARPVGVAIGPDGTLYFTSLYLGGNVGSPNCYSDLVMLRGERRPDSEPVNLVTAADETLWQELSHRNFHRRASAHQEILRRRGDLLKEAVQRLQSVDVDDPAVFHLPWLAAASGFDKAHRTLFERMHDPHASVRLQAVRALAEFRDPKAHDDEFDTALDDSDPHVLLAALVASFPAGRLLPSGARNLATSGDTYVRQIAAKLLALRVRSKELARMAKFPDAATRLAAVLAIGTRLTVPPHDFVPPDSLPLTYDSGNASFTLRFADADQPVDLRALARIGSFTTADWWKAVPPTPERQELFNLLLGALDDMNSDVVEQATYFLSLLKDDRAEPRIAAARRRVLASQAAGFAPRTIDRAWMLEAADDPSFTLEAVAPPDRGPVDLAATYRTATGKVTWTTSETMAGRLVDRTQKRTPASHRYLCFQLQSVSREPATINIQGGTKLTVWQNGRPIDATAASAALELHPGGNDIVLRVDGPPAEGVGVQFRAAASVVATVPERTDASLLSERLKQASGGADTVPAALLAIDWTAAEGGNVHEGRKLFGTLGCTKCHGITLSESGGGAPNLADLRRRYTRAYVVESILTPSKQVADPFRGTTLALADGRTFSGLVVNDSEDRLELLLPDAKRIIIPKAEIEERSPSPISPMPSGIVKTEQELRDLLAYLFSESPTPP